MKNSFKTKALALALSVCMMLSLTVFTLIPASAADEVEGMWNTYGLASESDPDYLGEKKSVPGFEYTEDGFKMTTADWSTSSPFSQMSTTQKVDLKEGVYMEVRVDDFDYDASDRWFNFFLWSTPHIDEGAKGFGEGVQTIIRPSASTNESLPGKLSGIAWFKEEFTSAGTTTFADDGQVVVDDKNILTLIVTYSVYSGYTATINGSAAPERVVQYMNDHFGVDSMAYVGFAMLSSKAGGSQEATLLKFGTSAATAETPVSMGTDSKPAEDHVYNLAEIADPSTVPAGQPAILMTGDIGASHLSNFPKSQIGCRVQITPDYTVKVGTDSRSADAGYWAVDSDVSYAIEDFPVVFCITKNLCSCGDDQCWAYEEAYAYITTGDSLAPSSNNKCYLTVCSDSYYIGGDSYLFFMYDTTYEYDKFQGRINGARLDFYIDIITVGANEFEVVLQAFFRTEEEAEAFALAYFKALGWENPNDYVEDETDKIYDETESPVEDKDYEAGYRAGIDEVGNTGYEDGYTDGFGGTYMENYNPMEYSSSDSYMRGFVDGYNEKYSSTYEEGYGAASYVYTFYRDGYTSGYEAGYKEGNKGNNGNSNGNVNNSGNGNSGNGNSGNGNSGNGNSGNSNNSYDAGYNAGYAAAIKDMKDSIAAGMEGCENSIGGIAIILLSAIPATIFIFKRKKDD